ncbi:MAG: hypothetical protein GEV08_18810 [Acidimicrobiia bacterium]|nr:hypothetical protein [Acidimicrobiia bacterium]
MHTDTATPPVPRPTGRRRVLALALFVAALAPFLVFHSAAPAAADASARFSFQVLWFVANDETGSDWAGSDEVYTKTWDHSRGSYGSGHTRSSTYQGVDRGESRTIKATEQCISATVALNDKNGNGNLNGSVGDTWACRTGDLGHGRLDATVKLYEQETFGDELIGTKNFVIEKAALESMLPQVGDYTTIQETFDRSGNYLVSFKITRVN